MIKKIKISNERGLEMNDMLALNCLTYHMTVDKISHPVFESDLCKLISVG